MFMNHEERLRAFDDILNGVLDAREQLNGLAERIDQFALFRGQLPPELDEVAGRWNREAEALASAMNQRELEPIVEQLQRFRLTTRADRL